MVREVGKPIAGKTGTTNEAKDLWFVGFSPDLVVGLYLGYDKPRSLGKTAQGGHTAAPIALSLIHILTSRARSVMEMPPPAAIWRRRSRATSSSSRSSTSRRSRSRCRPASS